MIKELKECLESGASNEDALFFFSCLNKIASSSPETAQSILSELHSQRTSLKLIASENYSSLAVQAALGTLFTDKYAEGVPFHRFYAGCETVDDMESRTAEKACRLFGAEHAYVQPHSGADANLCAYCAILQEKVIKPYLEECGKDSVASLSDSEWSELRNRCHSQRLLGLDYYSGGHLTHGYRQNVSAQMFVTDSYSVNPETGLLDYAEIEKRAKEFRPLILLAGYSAYPRKVNFKSLRSIADSVGAVLMVDMAHFAGLVAGGVLEGEYSPFPWADVVTTTTHKTLRGPRGGMVLCRNEFAQSVDKGCPLVIGGPLEHAIAAKEVALTEALSPSFKEYARQIVANSQALAAEFVKQGIKVQTGGSDNHIVLINVSPLGINGRQGESALRECRITLNRNALPLDPNGPWYTSGLRLGTPALTTLGLKEGDFVEVGAIISEVLKSLKPATLVVKGEQTQSKVKYVLPSQVRAKAIQRVTALLSKFPLYPGIAG